MGNHGGFSENILGFVKIPLGSMSNIRSDHVVTTCVKPNHIHKGLDENLAFLSYLKVNMILHHERSLIHTGSMTK